jgi:hypothetical protein
LTSIRFSESTAVLSLFFAPLCRGVHLNLMGENARAA